MNGSNRHNSPEALARLLLLLLLSTDIAFILLHFLLHATVTFSNPLLSLEKDQGYSEFFQYQKEFWIIILLIMVSIRARVLGYMAWALLFFYLLCDDAFQFHERYGGFIANKYNLPALFGLRAQDLGELFVSLMIGLFFVALMLCFYLKGSEVFKKSARHLTALIITLAFFGVFVDTLHVASKIGWQVSFLLGILEDGGELVAMSFIVWYVFLLNICSGHIDFSLLESIKNKFLLSH